MSVEGKIQSLFTDREQTQAIFPTTKVKAVSDDNGVGLNAILEDMLYAGELTGEVETAPVDADTLGGRLAEEYATQNYVAAEIAKAQLNGGDVDLSGFATKDDVSNAINGINYPVDSVNGKTGTVVLNAENVGAAPASHVEDKNNPHNITPEQIGAHSNTWIPTIAQIGAAPVGLIDGIGSYPSYADFMVNLKSTYGNMPTQTKRFLCMNLQASGDMSNGELGGGTWFVELNKADNRYGYAEATSYSGTGKVRIHRQEIFGSEWKGWKDESRDAFTPSWYGLGELGAYCSDCNNATKNGWFWVDGNTANIPESGMSGVLFVESRNKTGSVDYYQTLRSDVRVYRRYYSSYAGEWQPWECENPRMELGVEYRTTERHDGKVVYAQAVYLGVPAEGTTTVSIPTGKPIRHTAQQNNGYDLPYGSESSSLYCRVDIANYTAKIVCGSQFFNTAGITIQVWYTKD